MDELLRPNDTPVNKDKGGRQSAKLLKEKSGQAAAALLKAGSAAKAVCGSAGRTARKAAAVAGEAVKRGTAAAGPALGRLAKNAGETAKKGAAAAKSAAAAAKVKLTEQHSLREVAALAASLVGGARDKVAGAVARHPVSPLLYLTIAALVFGVVTFRSTYVPAYAVSVNGVEVGVVADTAEVDAAVTDVQKRVASIVGEDYELDPEVVFIPVYSTTNELSDTAELEEYFYNTATPDIDAYYEAYYASIMQACVLTIDGVEIGMAASEEDVRALLDRIAEPYITSETVDYGFVADIELTFRQMPSDTEFDLEPMYDFLTANYIEEAVYVVEKGDTFSRIAKELGMTMDQLAELNPDVVIDKIWVGDELIIQRPVPYLSVWTVDNETYEEIIESPIEYTETDKLYRGDTKVTEFGEDGLANVNADVKYVNGYEVTRDVITSETLKEPTTTYMLKGTKARPKTASTGHYIWPASGKLTSLFGYRNFRGSRDNHTGIDIAVPTGTNVKAADGGRVTFAGWNNNGYGYLVIITHDNGNQTYYAHNSKLLVKAGDKVYQGQAIARSGSTGNSTGPHVHFEIRIGGRAKNPLNYL